MAARGWGPMLVVLALLAAMPRGGAAQVVGGIVPGGTGPASPTQGPAPGRDQSATTGTAVIRGRVTDRATGAPVRRAEVRIMGSGLREPRMTRTDEQGTYRFDTLAAGSYTVNVFKSGYVQGGFGQTGAFEPARTVRVTDARTADGIDVTLLRGSVITGRILDEFGDPVPDAQVWVLRYRAVNGVRRLRQSDRPTTTNDIGEFRLSGLPPGEVVVSASARASGMSFATTGMEDRIGYPPTFYPGTWDPAGAQALTLAPGQQIFDLTMALMPSRAVRVSGTAFDAQGAPLRQGSVSVMQRDSGLSVNGAFGQVRPDGSFTIGNLPPGSYRFTAATGPFLPNAQPAMAVAELVVGSEDVSGVQLIVPQPVTLSGRIIVDPGAATTLRPGMLRTVMTSFDDLPLMRPNIPPTPVNDDLTFSMQVYPGLVSIRLAGLPPGWIVKGVTLSGQDAFSGVAVDAADAGGWEIELSNRAPDLAVSVADADGRPVPGALVAVFPQDPMLRARPMAGRSLTLRVDDEGKLRLRTIMPGQYYIATARNFDMSLGVSAEFLESLLPQAERLDLLEGDAKTINLKLPR